MNGCGGGGPVAGLRARGCKVAKSPAERMRESRARKAAQRGATAQQAGPVAQRESATPAQQAGSISDADKGKPASVESKPLEVISGAASAAVAKPGDGARVDPGATWRESAGNVAILERECGTVQITAKDRQRAGLRPAWRAGQSGNAAGRPSAGLVVKEWWNALAGKPPGELRAIAEDETAPVAKRAAAKRWLDGIDEDGQGRGAAIEQIVSHTDGKAAQRVEQRIEQVSAVAHVHVLATDPAVIAMAQRILELQDEKQ